jgi:N-acyl-D-amino-acid deacylase
MSLNGSLPGSATAEDAAPPQVTGVPNDDLSPLDKLMSEFVAQHQAPGAALAVTRGSKLVYARGFGMADVDAKRPVQPDSLFRLASISKPLTAVAVMQLAEQSKFGLDDKIFDLLPAADWLPSKYDERLKTITVRHLLQHTGGWDREKTFDPIGRVRDISRTVNKSLPVGPADVIRYTLTLPLDFDPGSKYAYYNVDYLLLGRLIEKASGQPYEEYVKTHVLAPAGVTRMQLGRAWKGDLATGEVCYYDTRNRTVEAICGSKVGTQVPVVYGGENLEAYEAHGGWIGSAVDLVRFASTFDNANSPKLLKPETIKAMWSRPAGAAGHDGDGKPRDSYYGCGWSVRPVDVEGRANVWHTGLITGTSTIMVRRHDGFNWAVLFNTDVNPKGERLSSLIDPLVHQAIDAVKTWPTDEVSIH